MTASCKLAVIEVALKSGEDIDWFLEYINGYYRAITMVSYDSVREQLNHHKFRINHISSIRAYKSRNRLPEI